MMYAIHAGLFYGVIAGCAAFGCALTIAALWVVLNVLADCKDFIMGEQRRGRGSKFRKGSE